MEVEVQRNRAKKNTTLLASMSLEGMGPCVERRKVPLPQRSLRPLCVKQVLVPTLRPAQAVVLDNLTAHKSERVRELVEGRDCELLFLPHPILAGPQMG